MREVCGAHIDTAPPRARRVGWMLRPCAAGSGVACTRILYPCLIRVVHQSSSLDSTLHLSTPRGRRTPTTLKNNPRCGHAGPPTSVVRSTVGVGGHDDRVTPAPPTRRYENSGWRSDDRRIIAGLRERRAAPLRCSWASRITCRT